MGEATVGEATLWGMIDAVPIRFPLLVDDLDAAALVFPVPAEAAQALVPGDAFEVVESEPGTADFLIVALEYHAGSWRAYNGLYLGPRVRPVGAPHGRTGTFLLPAPVSDRFGYEVAYRVLGLPGSVEDLEMRLTDVDVTVSLRSCGRHALTLRLPRVRSDEAPRSIDIVAYGYLDGRPQVIPYEFDEPQGAVDGGDVVVELGTGWLADTLRDLGLPRRPTFCAWGEGLSAVFGRAEPLPA